MQTIMIVATLVFGIGIMLFVFFSIETHLLERVLVGKGRKGPAWNVSSALLGIELDANGDISALVYSGFARNRGRAESAGVVRRWERNKEQPDRWLSGVVWEYQVRQIHQLPFVRYEDTLCMVDYNSQLRAVDIGSGKQRWQRPLQAQPAEPLVLDEDAHVVVEFEDSTWVRINPADGQEVATGRFEQPRDDARFAQIGSPSVFQRVDTTRAIVGNVLITTAQDDFEDDEADAQRAIVVKPASEAYGGERRFTASPEPPPGRHVLELSGRTLLCDSFVVADKYFVFLSGHEKRDSVDVFAEIISIETLKTLASIPVGSGALDSSIGFTHALGPNVVMRITNIRPDAAAPAMHVSYVLDPGKQRMLARIADGGHPAEFINRDGQTIWRGVI